jgi:hypothetical protein
MPVLLLCLLLARGPARRAMDEVHLGDGAAAGGSG